jgi:tRNA 2-thiouridine synthesizing protein A
MMTDNHPDSVLDVTGLLCPLPVLKARKRLTAMPSGAMLTVIASDPMSAIDMPHFCAEQGHELVSSVTTENRFHFRIKRQ